MDSNTREDTLASEPTGFLPVGRFLALCMPVAIVVFATAYAFTDMRFKEQLAQMVTIERVQLRQLGSYVTNDVTTALVHLHTLAGEKLTRRALDSRYLRDLQALQTEFAIMARRNPLYQKIRWIDEDGSERVMVARDGSDVSIATAQELLDQSDRYYFRSARSLSPGELYISHLDLKMETTGDAIPGGPTLRVATPLQDGYGRRRGILIINVDMRRMIDALASVSKFSQDTDYSLINKEGFWLDAGDPAQRNVAGFGTAMAFPRAHPGTWERMSASYSGYAELDDGFWAWERLETDEAIRRAFALDTGGGADMPNIDSSAFSITLVAHRPPGALVELKRDIFTMVMSASALFLGAYIWGVLFLLGGQFRERRAELDAARATARAEQLERHKEFEKRFRLVVEASGVGMVVVDPEGTILMNNSTAESLLGYPEGGLKGVTVDDLLPPAQRDHHAKIRLGYLENPEVRKMGAGRKLEALTADGRRIPVEVGLNPFVDRGTQLVLASIIDLSDRVEPGLQAG